ncbi:hypothetical protein M8C21_019827 [Ambrosia artemisiifolia]|uniref:Uncharacterized protein n=1 Tax=Ambrosia artemisiifolia TaxID=4212 RepID=A0AAD5G5L0_AMBAR|nr:hypothetical protein M8C21_019827 [Ambrosia artemisiifolia]
MFVVGHGAAAAEWWDVQCASDDAAALRMYALMPNEYHWLCLQDDPVPVKLLIFGYILSANPWSFVYMLITFLAIF